MERVLLDTSVLIDYLRGVENAKAVIERVESGNLDGFVSAVTVAEIYASLDESDKSETVLIEALLSLFTTVPLDYKVAKKAGELRNKSGVLLPDCIIAATAVTLECKVWTMNIKDFERMEGIIFEKPY
jgi:hypothetical protein